MSQDEICFHVLGVMRISLWPKSIFMLPSFSLGVIFSALIRWDYGDKFSWRRTSPRQLTLRSSPKLISKSKSHPHWQALNPIIQFPVLGFSSRFCRFYSLNLHVPLFIAAEIKTCFISAKFSFIVRPRVPWLINCLALHSRPNKVNQNEYS